jgi:hypothetical protein
MIAIFLVAAIILLVDDFLLLRILGHVFSDFFLRGRNFVKTRKIRLGARFVALVSGRVKINQTQKFKIKFPCRS